MNQANVSITFGFIAGSHITENLYFSLKERIKKVKKSDEKR